MTSPHTLPAHALLNLPARRGDVVRVESGAIWFTVAGQDIVLQAGESFAIPQGQNLLIETFSPSRFQVEGATSLRVGLPWCGFSAGRLRLGHWAVDS